MLWKIVKGICTEAYKKAFVSDPYRIIGKDTDDLTGRAIFSLKANRIPTILKLKTKKIMYDDHYLCGLSSNDRKQVQEQYLLELNQPLAFIEEYPSHPNKNNEYHFKIFLIDSKKIICGSASHFIKDNKDVLSMLSDHDIVKISMAYYLERFGEREFNKPMNKSNVHCIK